MIFDWSEALPGAVQSLSPRHRQVVEYVLSLPGRKKPSHRHALERWGLSREEFNAVIQDAYSELRQYFLRLGITAAADLDIR
jgi:hypothetical protein